MGVPLKQLSILMNLSTLWKTNMIPGCLSNSNSHLYPHFRFLSLTRNFYKKSHVVVVMYDITQDDSFLAVKQWIATLTESLGEDSVPPILLLGNKLDLSSSRTVKQDSAEELASVFGAEFGGEVSCKTGENIAKAFSSIVRSV